MTTLLDKMFGIFLGIEFKEDSIVITYLKNNLSGVTLLSSSTFPLSDDDASISEVQKYLNKHAVEVNKVFVSIPDKWAITKFIDIPSIEGKSKNALANLMRFEIERHIPFQIEDVAYDFMVLDQKDKEKTYSVVFVAVQKGKIDIVKEFLEKLTIQPHAITISSFAVLNTIELSGIPVGGWQEIIGIVRTSNVFGKNGEANISLYIDKMDASLAVIRNGFCTHLRSFVLDIAQPSETLIDDIVKYITQIRSLLSIDRFNKLILTGDISSITDYTDDLKEKLRINNVTIEQIRKYAGYLKGVQTNGLASSLGASFAGLGIGTYRINLLPHKMGYEVNKTAPLSTKIFLVLILILVIGIFTTDAVKQKKFLTKMEEVLKKNEPAVKALEMLSSDSSVLRKRSDLLRNVNENEVTLEILAELASLIPKDSWITNLNYKGINFRDQKETGGELIISGYATSSSTLIPLLEDSPFFEKVEFVGSIKKTRDKEQFKLSAQVIKPVD